jgi:hypothetical protein
MLAEGKGRDREEKRKKEKGEKSFELPSSHGFWYRELIRREKRAYMQLIGVILPFNVFGALKIVLDF